jgi:hypothetical protein
LIQGRKPRPCYGALNNKVKVPKRRGGVGDFTKPLEGEEEAAAERIGGEARSVNLLRRASLGAAV